MPKSNAVKPGYLTTEFWLTTAVLVLTNLKTLPFPSRYNWVVDAAAVAGYALSRGLAKLNTPAAGVQQPVADEPADAPGL